MNQTKKNLVIFDFDQTIAFYDALFFLFPLVYTKEEEDKLLENEETKNYVDLFNLFFNDAKKSNISLLQIDEKLKQLEFSPGMMELLNYLRDNKQKYEVIIISSNCTYLIDKILEFHQISDLFSVIYCNPSKIENETIVVSQKEFHNCKLCNPCQCKRKEINHFFKEKGRENYDKIFFIGDGGNDLCLAETLSESDVTFPRINYNLYKKILMPENASKIHCKIVPWNNGLEVKDYLAKLV